MLRRKPPALTAPVDPLRLTARQLIGNLVITPTHVEAVYRMGPQPWDFRSNGEKQYVLDSAAHRWAALAPITFRERVTTQPHPGAEWARKLDQRTPHPLPDMHYCRQSDFTATELAQGLCRCESYNQNLARQQRRIKAAGLDDSIVYRIFQVAPNPVGHDIRKEITSGKSSQKVREVLAAAHRVEQLVKGPGFDGRPATGAEVEALMHKSTALHIPAPREPWLAMEGYDTGDMGTFADRVVWESQPFDDAVKITTLRGGVVVSRWVAVLTMGVQQPVSYPESGLEPWMVYAERVVDSAGATFPVEWSTSGYLATGPELTGITERELRRAIDIREGAAEHGDPVPPAQDRAIQQAVKNHDETTDGTKVEAVRFLGPIRAAIPGNSLEEVRLRAQALIDLYGGQDLRMKMEWPKGQLALLREFIPGEPYMQVGHQRRMRVQYLAAAMPNISSAVGDAQGPYYGYTRGAARRAFHHDSHYMTEGRKGRRANLWPIVGTPGQAGKSVACGYIGYMNADRGTRVVINDPSGPLSRLVYMPRFGPLPRAQSTAATVMRNTRRDAQGRLLEGQPPNAPCPLSRSALHLNMLDADRGTLSPPSLILDPTFASVDHEPKKYLEALALAKQDRRVLTVDVVRMALEAGLYEHHDTRDVIGEAATRLEWTSHATIWDLVGALENLGVEHATRLARAITRMSDTPRLSLMFPERGDSGEAKAQHERPVLTVITTPGLVDPSPLAPREDWTTDELVTRPLRHLARFYARRELYGKKMEERAVGIFDEVHADSSGSGRAFDNLLNRDSSKWNLAIYKASQNVSDVLASNVANFVAGAFVGAMEDEDEAREALKLLKVKDDHYLSEIMHLSEEYRGEFIHRDGDGDVGGIRFDLEHFPELKAALVTDPRHAGSEAWAV